MWNRSSSIGFRAFLLAAFLALVPGSRAHALIFPEDLPVAIQRAKRVIKGRVGEIIQPREYGEKVAVVDVLETFSGPVSKQVKILFALYEIEPRELESGEVDYFCLDPSSRDPGFWEQRDCGYSTVKVENGRIIFEEKRVPTWLKRRVPGATEEEFSKLVPWILGPVMTVEACASESSCLDPLFVDIKVTNTTTIPMELVTGSGIGFSQHFHATLLDERGFTVGWGNGGDFKGQSFPRELTRGTATLKPGESYSGRIRLLVSMYNFEQDPRNARTMRVWYYPREMGKGEFAWLGRLDARVPIRLTCPYPAWAETLQKPNGECLVEIGLWPEQRFRLRVTVRKHPFDVDSDVCGGEIEPLPGKIMEELGKCIRLRYGREWMRNLEPDRALLLDFLAKRETFSVEWELLDEFDLRRKGSYSLRFVFPGTRGDSASAMEEFEVE